jgi:hypothetical protein
MKRSILFAIVLVGAFASPTSAGQIANAGFELPQPIHDDGPDPAYSLVRQCVRVRRRYEWRRYNGKGPDAALPRNFR